VFRAGLFGTLQSGDYCKNKISTAVILALSRGTYSSISFPTVEVSIGFSPIPSFRIL
jgi:hypothetical protein